MLTDKMTRCYFIISTAVIIFVVYVSITFNNTESDSYQWDKIINLNHGWTCLDKDGNQRLTDLPIAKKTSAGETYTLIHTLPDNLAEGSTLCFKNDHLLVNAYVDGKEVYSLKVDDRSTIGKSPGFAYVFIPLISDMAGKQIKIEYTAVYTGSSFHITEFFLGDKSTIITGIIRLNMLPMLVCSLSGCLGVVFIITYCFKRKTFQMSKSLFYLGLFAIPLMIWSLTETQTMQFFFSNTYALQYVTYLSLASCAYPFLMFFAERHRLNNAKVVQVMGIFCFLSTLICLGLQAFGIVDLPDTLFLVHISIACVVIYTMYHSILELMQKDKKKPEFSLSGISLVLLLTCTVIDLARYYCVVNEDYSKYTRVGFLVYLGCTGLSTILHSVQIDEEKKELEQLAFVDSLTGLRNQLAFERQIQAEDNPNTFAALEINVQKLDEITKNYGSEARQELLSSTGKMIEKTFPENTGKYYLGDNRFVVILYDDIEQIYNIGMGLLKKRVLNSNKSRVQKLSISDTIMMFNDASKTNAREIFKELGITSQDLEEEEFVEESQQ